MKALLSILILWSTGIPAWADAQPRSPRPLLGVQRWDMYSGEGATQQQELGYLPGKQGFLKPAEWHDRAPFFVRRTEDVHSVEHPAAAGPLWFNHPFNRELLQQSMDQEIRFAHDAGIDFFIYHGPARKVVGRGGWGLRNNLDAHLASKIPEARKTKFVWALYGHKAIHYTRDKVTRMMDETMPMIRMSNWQTVMDGRPLVIIMWPGQFRHQLAKAAGKQAMTGPEFTSYLRRRVKAAGLKNPYLVGCISPAKSFQHAEALKKDGYDAFMDYAGGYGGAVARRDESPTYAAATAGLLETLHRDFLNQGLPFIPSCTSMQYPWPRALDKNTGKALEKWYHYQWPEKGDLAARVNAVLDFVATHPKACEAQLVSMYSWNECSEGGALIPTMGKAPDYTPVTTWLDEVAGALWDYETGEGRQDGESRTVSIDTSAPARPYDRMIFGGFLEHFDNQIYGGIFEPGSPLADEAGFRTDVLEALRELKMPVIRWPGGCFVDAYHWQKGVGEKREAYGDFRWGVIEPNTFGTDEFVALCRRIGAEPYICFNGLASPQENLDWVAYCNATEGKFAEMRTANGHPEPFKVKFWSVGNERYDKAYIHRVRDTAKEMKRLYPDVLITCSGAQDGMKGVHEYLMQQAGEHLDYVSIHSYALNRGNELPRYDYLTAIGTSEGPEAFIANVAGSLKERNVDGRIKIAYDEWNLRAWQHPGFPRNKVDDYDAPAVRDLVKKRRQQNDQADQYTMADALFAASFLNACLRHADTVTMANIAPLVNTRGPLFAHPKGIVKRPHYHTLWMYANLLEERIAKTQIASEQLTGTPVTTVDAMATVDASGRQYAIALINRHPTESVPCTLKINGPPLEGAYPATLLTAASAATYNDIANPDRVAPKTVEITFKNGAVTLPPHSLVVVRVPLGS